MFTSILWKVFLWSGTKLFDGVDIYSPGIDDEADVVAVTFSNNDEYLVKVGNIELES